MQSLLNRFNLQSAKWNSGIAMALMILWIVVLGCIVSSILAQPFDRRQRIFWIALVILLPGVGVLAYLPFALKKEELPAFFQRRKRSRRQKPSAVDPDA